MHTRARHCIGHCETEKSISSTLMWETGNQPARDTLCLMEVTAAEKCKARRDTGNP